jgi:hypothetical protein
MLSVVLILVLLTVLVATDTVSSRDEHDHRAG